jgi:hypothetical protein
MSQYHSARGGGGMEAKQKRKEKKREKKLKKGRIGKWYSDDRLSFSSIPPCIQTSIPLLCFMEALGPLWGGGDDPQLLLSLIQSHPETVEFCLNISHISEFLITSLLVHALILQTVFSVAREEGNLLSSIFQYQVSSALYALHHCCIWILKHKSGFYN